jgi:hypothetical protein
MLSESRRDRGAEENIRGSARWIFPAMAVQQTERGHAPAGGTAAVSRDVNHRLSGNWQFRYPKFAISAGGCQMTIHGMWAGGIARSSRCSHRRPGDNSARILPWCRPTGAMPIRYRWWWRSMGTITTKEQESRRSTIDRAIA